MQSKIISGVYNMLIHILIRYDIIVKLASIFWISLYKFESLGHKTNVNSKKDVVANKADFIIEHKGQHLTDMYKVDEQILGEGAFGKVQRCIHKVSKEIRAVKILNKA